MKKWTFGKDGTPEILTVVFPWLIIVEGTFREKEKVISRKIYYAKYYMTKGLSHDKSSKTCP